MMNIEAHKHTDEFQNILNGSRKPTERPRGQWIPQTEYDFEINHDAVVGFCCNRCGFYYTKQHNPCPNCHADMEQQEEHQEEGNFNGQT